MAASKRQEVRSRRIHYVNATITHVQRLKFQANGEPVFRMTFADQDGNVFAATTHARGTYHERISPDMTSQRVKLTWHHDTRGNKIVLDLEDDTRAA